MPVLYEDTLQQVHDGDKHAEKHAWWEAHGIEVVRTRFDGAHGVPIDFGDYYREGSNVVVDTKRSVSEVAQNISGKQHGRFRDECMRAQRRGYRLVVLVENGHGYRWPSDVARWTNAHCRACHKHRRGQCDPSTVAECARHGTKPPPQGVTVSRAMETMAERYGTWFMLCDPGDAARIVCELLGVDYDDKAD